MATGEEAGAMVSLASLAVVAFSSSNPRSILVMAAVLMVEAGVGSIAADLVAAALEEDTAAVSPDDPTEALVAETLMHSWARTWLGEPVTWALCLLTKLHRRRPCYSKHL